MKRGMVFRIISETGEEGARCWRLLGDRRLRKCQDSPTRCRMVLPGCWQYPGSGMLASGH